MTDDYLDHLLDEFAKAEPREAWDDVLRRARRSRRRYVIVAVALATLVLVPSAWAIQRALSAKHYVPSYAPSAQQIVDLSWSSPQHGWALLGRTCGGSRNRCAIVEETHNSGESWEHLASLPAQIGTGSNGGSGGGGGFCSVGHACVARIAFVTPLIGYAYGPALFMTTDRGTLVGAHLGAPGGKHGDVTRDGLPDRLSTHRMSRPVHADASDSSAGTRAWAPVPAPAGAGNGDGESIYAAGRTLYVFSWGNVAGGVSSHAAIAVSRDKGRTWSRIADPCGSTATDEWDAVDASAVREDLGVLCVPKSGGRPFVAISRDAGRTFTKGAPLTIDTPEQIAISSSGAVAVGNAGVTGGGPFVYELTVSRDGGRTWRVAVRDPQKVAIDLAAGFLQFVGRRKLDWVGYPYSLWQGVGDGRPLHRTVLKPERPTS